MLRKKARNRLTGRERRHRRVRVRVKGTSERPRLCVFRSSKHIYAQVIDDDGGRTLLAVSSLTPVVRDQGAAKPRGMALAKLVGKVLAETAREKGISKVAFDRGGYQYHGHIKALAEGSREGGLEF